jgi:hypothetical protein
MNEVSREPSKSRMPKMKTNTTSMPAKAKQEDKHCIYASKSQRKRQIPYLCQHSILQQQVQSSLLCVSMLITCYTFIMRTNCSFKILLCRSGLKWIDTETLCSTLEQNMHIFPQNMMSPLHKASNSE